MEQQIRGQGRWQRVRQILGQTMSVEIYFFLNLGYMSEERWLTLVDQLKSIVLIDRAPEVKDLFIPLQWKV